MWSIWAFRVLVWKAASLQPTISNMPGMSFCPLCPPPPVPHTLQPIITKACQPRVLKGKQPSTVQYYDSSGSQGQTNYTHCASVRTPLAFLLLTCVGGLREPSSWATKYFLNEEEDAIQNCRGWSPYKNTRLCHKYSKYVSISTWSRLDTSIKSEPKRTKKTGHSTTSRFL